MTRLRSQGDSMGDAAQRAKIVRALRAAADAVERGADLEAYNYTEGEGYAYELTPDRARAELLHEIRDVEYFTDDVRQLVYGVAVPVERTHVDVMPADHDYGDGTAAEHGIFAWWEVSLVDAWPSTVDA